VTGGEKKGRAKIRRYDSLNIYYEFVPSFAMDSNCGATTGFI